MTTLVAQVGPPDEVVSDLYRLVEALDRRVPRLDRSTEAKIALDAAVLRERAISMIHQLEGEEMARADARLRDARPSRN